jgi:alcohol dehydrogenase
MTAEVAALVLHGPRDLAVRHYPRPEIEDDTALLRVELVGICGTDVKTYAGSMPYPFPLVLGHEIVGRIEQAGPRFLEEKGIGLGDRVYVAARVPCWSCAACQGGDFRSCLRPCGYGTWTPADRPPHLWGGMAQFMHLAAGSMVRVVPPDVSPAAALMAQTVVANGFEWVRLVGGLRPGGIVAVQGCGPQGLGAVIAALADGAESVFVTGLRRDERRLQFAQRSGAVAIVVDDEDPVEVVGRQTGGRMADVVVNVTGSPGTLTQSLRLARDRGTIALAGLAGRDVEASLPVDEIVWRELAIRGCFSKGLEATDLATRFLERGAEWLPLLHDLVTDVVGLDDVEQALLDLEGKPATAGPIPVKVAVDPWLGRS